MGSIFSTFLLLGGAAVSSVLSAIAARAAAQKNWGKALKYAIISAVLSGIVVLTSLAIVIKNKSSAVSGEVVPGVDLSLILMSVVMAVMTGLNSYAAYEASSSSGKTTRKAEEFAAIAATVGLSGVVLSFVMIILLA